MAVPIIRWIIYSVCIFIIAITAYRLIASGAPDELKNYIITSDKIEKAHLTAISAKDEFKIYKIDIRDSFAIGDAIFADNIYYLENAENLQLTLRCKNSRLQAMFGYVPDDEVTISLRPPFFKYYLKVSSVNPDADIDESSYIQDYVVLETVNESAFGKDSDRYRYYVLSFDGVQIEYATTKVELFAFDSSSGIIPMFDENAYLARFTLFDINMPKEKIPAKKFRFN